jgi:hypothetical protein
MWKAQMARVSKDAAVIWGLSSFEARVLRTLAPQDDGIELHRIWKAHPVRAALLNSRPAFQGCLPLPGNVAPPRGLC